MDRHRVQSNGSLRDSDNWQKGSTRPAIMKSLWRHFLDLWLLHRGHGPKSHDAREHLIRQGLDYALEEILCALLFNVQAYLREVILRRSHEEPSPVASTYVRAETRIVAFPNAPGEAFAQEARAQADGYAN